MAKRRCGRSITGIRVDTSAASPGHISELPPVAVDQRREAICRRSGR